MSADRGGVSGPGAEVRKVTTPAEVAALRAVRHPHLVQPLRLADGEIGGAAPVLVTARAPGGDLARRLHRDGAMGSAGAAALLAPVADALAACHDAGVVHGDVSAANILLAEHGALLADLGAARGPALGADPGAPTGTPGSTAPEVLGGVPTDAAADVWALAAVVVEAAAGVVVDPHDIASTLATLDADLAGAMASALATDPIARPPAAILAGRLRFLAGAAAPPSPRPSTVDRRSARSAEPPPSTRRTREFGPRPPAATAPPARRRARPVAVLAVVVAVVAVGLAAMSSGRDGADDRRPAATGPSSPPSSPAMAAAACPPAPPPPGPGLVLAADVDGRGCPRGARWHDGVLVVAATDDDPVRRYALGAPGDIVAIGDWDCDGRATPGTYRPTTGLVTLYAAWPAPGAALEAAVVRTAAPGLGAVAVTGPDGCDDLRPAPPIS